MLVTALEKAKGTRWNVFVEGELALSVDVETLVSSGLKAGQEIGREALAELRHSVDSRRARERALYLLELRSHTKKELTQKLAKTVDADIAEETAARMEELGLVNDVEYAARLAHALATEKGWGPARIRQRLSEKGVERETATEALAELEERVDVQETLTRVIRKKYLRHLGDAKGRDKTIAALLRLGYRYGDVREALCGLADEIPDLPDPEELE